MIRLLYKGNNYAIMKATKKANEILQSATFYDKIASLPQMTNTPLSSPEIASILMKENEQVTIESFWNPFSKSAKITQPFVLKVITYKLSCITAFAVNTLINESILTIALKCEKLHFNSTDFDEMEYPNVFPWRIGEIAEILTRKYKFQNFETQPQ